jgi:predicted amidohydrolase
MKIALIQMGMTPDEGENLQKSLQKMEEAAKQGANLVLFPELQLSPFFPQHAQSDATRYLMTIDSAAIQKIKQKAHELDLVTIPNFYLKEPAGNYDACPVINNDGKIMGISRMVHIVQVEYFYEQDYYTPAEDGFKVYNTAAGKIGVVICFDRHFPESIRSCVLQGAEIIVIPTAIIIGEPVEKFEWEVRLAAWQNNVFIAMCNRVGTEDAVTFCGGSMLIDPDGEVLAQAGETEEILMSEIDFDRIEQSRKERQFLALRRPESYI